MEVTLECKEEITDKHITLCQVMRGGGWLRVLVYRSGEGRPPGGGDMGAEARVNGGGTGARAFWAEEQPCKETEVGMNLACLGNSQEPAGWNRARKECRKCGKN